MLLASVSENEGTGAAADLRQRMRTDRWLKDSPQAVYAQYLS